ncbi:DUF2877 domain-containing protein [Candidatus Leptofilum sp.]|uniref:oxamate carbamoyltransferase subunit AllH family protein n=1 Tax=Candidatus Leptofilum sp. TaxID=3241576 RepID=UPI003B591E9B
MESIQLSGTVLTPSVQQWLQKPKAVRLLHLFDEVINLINADGEIISVVQSQIKPGPFSLLVDEKRPFPTLIHPSASVTKTDTTLTIGSLEIDCGSAKLWNPIPNWHLLNQRQGNWLGVLPAMQTAVNQRFDTLGELGPANFNQKFQTAVIRMQAVRFESDSEAWGTAVAKLAGFGPGFTPAGDDFLVGFLFGLWATRPKDEVVELAKFVVETAVPRTTQLSAAWLQAAGRGEAWIMWHNLVEAFLSGYGWQLPVKLILEQGATSGIAALLGFIAATSRSWLAS